MVAHGHRFRRLTRAEETSYPHPCSQDLCQAPSVYEVSQVEEPSAVRSYRLYCRTHAEDYAEELGFCRACLQALGATQDCGPCSNARTAAQAKAEETPGSSFETAAQMLRREHPNLWAPIRAQLLGVLTTLDMFLSAVHDGGVKDPELCDAALAAAEYQAQLLQEVTRE
jgi:hypothetical protein